jgi:L-iditol 2-dehydrogenase
MADYFAVPEANLTDTLIVDGLRAVDAALIEPLACVVKSVQAAGVCQRSAVIGLGVMGLMHMLVLKEEKTGFDLNPTRVEHARSIGLDARDVSDAGSAGRFDAVFVCPGSQQAFEFGMRLVEPGGTLVMFAPLAPQERLSVPQDAYFLDLRIVSSYSCGPADTRVALGRIEKGSIRAEQVCSDFIELEELPERYRLMRDGLILKPMVVWN